MKILLVSWSILPRSGGTSVIVENLARSFDKAQMVVLGASRFRQKDTITRGPGSPVFRYFFSELTIFGRGERFFDWFRRWRFKALVNEIKKVVQKENITHVIGVYPNHFYCLAACKAAKSLGIPFSSYFHNTYVENTAIKDPNARKYQDEIFENSDKVFVMSKGMQDFYEQKYGLSKFFPLVHSFDSYPDTTQNTQLPGTEKKKYKLVAIGNFNQSNLDATKRLVEAVNQSDQFTLSFYTHVPKILLNQRGLNTTLFEHMGAVSPDEIHSEIQKYDFCVLTHGFEGEYGEVEYKTIFPTRTIPLLLSGKPIFAHSPKGSFLNDFLMRHDCAELVDTPDVSQIIKSLTRMTNDANLQKKLAANAMRAAEQFHSPRVVESMLSNLRSS